MSGQRKSVYDELKKKRYIQKIFINEEEPIEEQEIERGGAINKEYQKYNTPSPYGKIIRYYGHEHPVINKIKTSGEKIDKIFHYRKKYYE